MSLFEQFKVLEDPRDIRGKKVQINRYINNDNLCNIMWANGLRKYSLLHEIERRVL